MSEHVCEDCGTSYPELKDYCPNCGWARYIPKRRGNIHRLDKNKLAPPGSEQNPIIIDFSKEQ